MGKSLVSIVGELMGKRQSPEPVFTQEEIVRITVEGRPKGPAENSIILIQNSPAGEKRARYLSWIGYNDLDRANASEPEVWSIIEPARLYEAEVAWYPFN